jgi:hypothetical protein
VPAPNRTAEELGKHTAMERFFSRDFSLFGVFDVQRQPLCDWSAVATWVAFVYAATRVVGFAA